jgi:hypothetical protein
MERLEYGYLFGPSRYGTSWGHEALDVWLSDEPTNEAFGVRVAEFTVYDGERFHLLDVTHPFALGRRSLQVGIGRFFLMPYHGNLVQGFSTGGELQIDNRGDFTWCHFSSTAPIFSLEGPLNDPVHLLVPEIEAELARLRATYGADDPKFYRKLGQLDPFETFVAALDFLRSRLDILRQLIPDDQWTQTAIALRTGIEAIMAAGEWPQAVPDFDDLLVNGQPETALPSPSRRATSPP